MNGTTSMTCCVFGCRNQAARVIGGTHPICAEHDEERTREIVKPEAWRIAVDNFKTMKGDRLFPVARR